MRYYISIYSLWVFTLLFIAKNVGVVDFGQFSLTIAVIMLLSLLSGGSSLSSYLYFNSADDTEKRYFFGNYIFSGLFGGILLSGLIYYLVVHLFSSHLGVFQKLYWDAIVITIAPFLMLKNLRTYIELSANKMITLFIEYLRVGLFLVLILFLYSKHLLSVSTSINAWVFLIGCFSISYIVFAWIITGRDVRVKMSLLPKYQGKVLKVFLIDFFYQLMGFLALLMIAYFWGFAELGLFVIPMLIAGFIWRISWVISNSVVVPGAVPRVNKEIKPQDIRKIFLNSILLSALVLIGGGLIMRYYLSWEYLSSFVVLLILLPGAVFITVSKLMTSSLCVLKNQGSILGTVLLILPFSVCLNYILIPSHGINGAAAAFSLIQLFYLVTVLFAYKNAFSIRLFEFFHSA